MSKVKIAIISVSAVAAAAAFYFLYWKKRLPTVIVNTVDWPNNTATVTVDGVMSDMNRNSRITGRNGFVVAFSESYRHDISGTGPTSIVIQNNQGVQYDTVQTMPQ